MANVVNNLYSEIGEFDYDNLVASSEMPILEKGVTLAAGQGVLASGTLLGIIDATGLAVLCNSTATDGSQHPKYILEHDHDTGATGATLTVTAVAYQSGIFNRDAIITVSGQDIRTFEAELRTNNIILKDTISYPTN